jgi:hypothetical protein
MGNVIALEYNFHVPLYFEGQAVRMRGWPLATSFGVPSVVGSEGDGPRAPKASWPWNPTSDPLRISKIPCSSLLKSLQLVSLSYFGVPFCKKENPLVLQLWFLILHPPLTSTKPCVKAVRATLTGWHPLLSAWLLMPACDCLSLWYTTDWTAGQCTHVNMPPSNLKDHKCNGSP